MTHIVGMQEFFLKDSIIASLQVHSNTKAAPKQPSERVRDKREMCELVSQAPGDWKNTEGSLVNKAFTAQRSPRDLCGSSTGSHVSGSLPVTTHLHTPPSDQSRARGSQDVIYTCICHWQEPQAAERYLMQIHGPPSKSSRAQCLHLFSFQGEGMATVAAIWDIRSTVCSKWLHSNLLVNSDETRKFLFKDREL